MTTKKSTELLSAPLNAIPRTDIYFFLLTNRKSPEPKSSGDFRLYFYVCLLRRIKSRRSLADARLVLFFFFAEIIGLVIVINVLDLGIFTVGCNKCAAHVIDTIAVVEPRF